jgi:hypothetical protein
MTPILRKPSYRRSSWRARQRGLSTVEYVVVLVLVAIVSLVLWQAFGGSVRKALQRGTGSLETLSSLDFEEASGTGTADIALEGPGSGVPTPATAPGMARPPAPPPPPPPKPPPPPPKPTTHLGSDVDAVASRSPTLSRDLETLRKQGWTIQYGAVGSGGFTDYNKKQITIDGGQKNDPRNASSALAHEVGHVLSPPRTTGPQGMTRAEYIAKNVDATLDSEGAATLKNLEVRDEVKTSGGPSMIVPGAHVADYEAIYKEYKDGKITRAEAEHRIGQIYADGETGSKSKRKYREIYSKAYGDDWDSRYPGKPPAFRAP